MPELSYLSTIFILFISSILLTKTTIHCSKRTPPSHRCSHQIATPTSGGIVFLVLFLCYSLWVFIQDPSSFYLLPAYCTGVSILTIVGFYDDIYILSYRLRLFAQCICALIMIMAGGIIQTPVIDFSSSSVLLFQQIITFITFLCIINGSNFIDGLNGLLGLNMCICLLFGPLWIDMSMPATLLYWHLSAIIFGFLIFNFPRGLIFMGDAGSTFLGYTLVFFGLLAQQFYPHSPSHSTAIFHKGFVFTLLPLAFIWFDVAFTLGRRAMRGEKLTQAHRDHMIHILFDNGHSHFFVTSLYSLGTIIMGFLTYLCFKEIISFNVLILIYAALQISFVKFVFMHRSSRI